MKKITKAVVLSAAGAILLAGGGGTLAAWTSTQSSSTMTLTSGNLALGNPALETGEWFVGQLPEGGGLDDVQSTVFTEFHPETDQLVPGDILYTFAEVPIELSGKNMRGSLSMTPTATSDGSAGGDALAAAIAAAPLTGTSILVSPDITQHDGDIGSASELEPSKARPGTLNITAHPEDSNGTLKASVRTDVSFQIPWDADMDTLNSTMKFVMTYALNQIPKNAAN